MEVTVVHDLTPTSVGTQNVAHGQSAAPKAAIVIFGHRRNSAIGDLLQAQIGYGFSDGTTEAAYSGGFNEFGEGARAADDKLLLINDLSGVFVDASTSSVDATNWVFNFTSVDSFNQHPFAVIFIGGSGIEANAVVDQISPVSNGNQNVAHGLTNQPTMALGILTEISGALPTNGNYIGCIGFWGSNGGTETQGVTSHFSFGDDSSRFQDQTNFLHCPWTSQQLNERAVVDSVDGTNMVLNWTIGQETTQNHFFILFLSGVDAEVIAAVQKSSTDITNDGHGRKAYTTAFQPAAALISSFGRAAAASIQVDNNLSLGGGIVASEGSLAAAVDDAYVTRADADGSRSSDTKVVSMITPGPTSVTLDADAKIDSFNAADITLEWTANDDVQRESNILVFRESPAADQPLYFKRGMVA